MHYNQSSNKSNEQERLHSVADLVEIAGRMASSTVVIAGGDRIEDLKLVESARDHGIIDRIVLVGRKTRIRQAVDELGIEIPEEDVMGVRSEDEMAAATTDLIKSGAVNIVLKGNISTPIINRHMLPLAIRPTVSLASIFDAAPITGGRPMILTDAGVTTVCNFGRMVDLIKNAVDVAQVVMGIHRPRVAVLSANEKQIPSLPSTWIGERLSKRQWHDAVVYGPLSFDLATDPESVAIKGLPDVPGAREVAGQADILVCPGIDAANILYKTISAMCKYGEASIAGITVGFPVPYIILSRADSLSTRLESIALCSIYAQRKLQAEKKKKPKVRISAQKVYRILTITPGYESVHTQIFENNQSILKTMFPLSPLQARPSFYHKASLKELVQAIIKWLTEYEKSDKIDGIAASGGYMPADDEIPLDESQADKSHAYESEADKSQADESETDSSAIDKSPRGSWGSLYQIAELHNGKFFIKPEIGFKNRENPGAGLLCAVELAASLRIPAFFAYSYSIESFQTPPGLAEYSESHLKGLFPKLSMNEALKTAAQSEVRPAEDLNLVVAHLDRLWTVAAIVRGEVVDYRSFSLQPSGESLQLKSIYLSMEYISNKLLKELIKLDEISFFQEIEKRIDGGDQSAQKLFETTMYQIAGEIGRMFVATGCDVEAVVLCGELMERKRFITSLRRSVGRLAPVIIMKGSLEPEALVSGTIDIFSGKVHPLQYQSSVDHPKQEI